MTTGWSHVSLQRNRRHHRRVSFGSLKRSNSSKEGSEFFSIDSSYRSRYLKIQSPEYSPHLKDTANDTTVESSLYNTPPHQVYHRDSSLSPAMQLFLPNRRHSTGSVTSSVVADGHEMNSELSKIYVDNNSNEESRGLTYPEDVYIGKLGFHLCSIKSIHFV